MIRLGGIVNLRALLEEAPAEEEKEEEETPEQDIDKTQVEMKLKKLKEMNLTQEQADKVDAMMSKFGSDKEASMTETEDHEVGMANNLLDDIIKNATELKEKLGQDEKDIPAWIQDHISQSQNFISQANVNYHEYDTPSTTPEPQGTLQEAAPEGWEKTIKAMKKKKEIDNPWALANWMKKKGYQPKKEGKNIV